MRGSPTPKRPDYIMDSKSSTPSQMQGFTGIETKHAIHIKCWLKKQDDPLAPDIQASGDHVMWTFGLIYGKDTGVLGIETEHGTIHIKLLVDCAPYSVAYLLELQKLRHCAGCCIYRAEGRGLSWDDEGDQIGQVPPTACSRPQMCMRRIGFQ